MSRYRFDLLLTPALKDSHSLSFSLCPSAVPPSLYLSCLSHYGADQRLAVSSERGLSCFRMLTWCNISRACVPRGPSPSPSVPLFYSSAPFVSLRFCPTLNLVCGRVRMLFLHTAANPGGLCRGRRGWKVRSEQWDDDGRFEERGWRLKWGKRWTAKVSV